MKPASSILLCVCIILLGSVLASADILVRKDAAMTIHGEVENNCQALVLETNSTLVVDGGRVTNVRSFTKASGSSFSMVNQGVILDCEGNPYSNVFLIDRYFLLLLQ